MSEAQVVLDDCGDAVVHSLEGEGVLSNIIVGKALDKVQRQHWRSSVEKTKAGVKWNGREGEHDWDVASAPGGCEKVHSLRYTLVVYSLWNLWGLLDDSILGGCTAGIHQFKKKKDLKIIVVQEI